jgi:hypothetical protein
MLRPRRGRGRLAILTPGIASTLNPGLMAVTPPESDCRSRSGICIGVEVWLWFGGIHSTNQRLHSTRQVEPLVRRNLYSAFRVRCCLQAMKESVPVSVAVAMYVRIVMQMIG